MARDAEPAVPHDLPEEYFFVLGQDGGVAFLERPDWILRQVSGARVQQLACSDFPETQARLEQGLDRRWTEGRPVVFEVNSVPVLARDVRFQGGAARIGGKHLLNGASGDRVFSQYLKRNPGLPAFRRSNRHFAAARDTATLDLPLAAEDLSNVPIGLECRNRTNYYHFMTEALPNLVHWPAGSGATITFHSRGRAPSAFSRAFVDALFPDLSGRVRFETGARRYDTVLQILNFRHVLYANGDPLITRPLSRARDDPAWEMVTSHARRRNLMFESSYDVSLRLLRDRAVALLPRGLTERFPRKIWVSRDNRSDINRRPMVGEDILWRELERQGFQRVFFEHLPPLDQIAAIRAADVIVSMHGAFFANMMFARPETHFIELGTLQTQRHRWGDFVGNAHASGCRYSTIFVDAAEPDPNRLRPISSGLSGVRVGPRAVDLIVAHAGRSG